jgi:hypothetical protein
VDTQKVPKWAYRFIILVPHRDALEALEKYRKRLFSTGFYGAYSFPMAAPLALVSRPLSREELKELGRNIRDLSKGKDGKIISGSAVQVNYSDKITFFGPSLSIELKESIFPESARDKILHVFSPPVLCVALPGSEEKPFPEEGPALSFRAAALVNLTLSPLDCGAAAYSFEWRMGHPVWLPGTRDQGQFLIPDLAGKSLP